MGDRRQERSCYCGLVELGEEGTWWLCPAENEKRKKYSFEQNKA
jgi:hypothetical protein